MINALTRTFFNIRYRLKPPPMVKYWLRSTGALARVIENEKTGAIEMDIQGEDERYPGFPQGPLLLSKVGKLKHIVKTEVFNVVGPKIRQIHDSFQKDLVPPHKLPPAVREIWDTFEKLEECEVTEDMKDRIRLMKEVICFLLNSDDAYRFRAQLFLELLDMKKVKLSKQDKYYFRGKYFKVDRYKKLFGMVIDAFQY